MSFLFQPKLPLTGKIQPVQTLIAVEERENFIEVKSNSIRRFGNYFDQLDQYFRENSNHVFGSCEPEELKKIRPFLLSTEIISSKVSPKMKKDNKAKGKKGKGKRKGGSKEIAKVFTASNPPPNLNRFLSNNSNMFRLTQELVITNYLTTSATIPTFSATSFTAGALDQYSSLSAVFDQYIIDEIETWIIPLGTGTNGTVGVGGGLYYTVIDYDDSTALTTVAQAEDYSNVVSAPQSEGVYRKFIPHIAVAAFSGTFTSYTNLPPQWIDTTSSSVQHYGIKTAAQTTNVATQYQMQVRYHMRFRNVR